MGCDAVRNMSGLDTGVDDDGFVLLMLQVDARILGVCRDARCSLLKKLTGH